MWVMGPWRPTRVVALIPALVVLVLTACSGSGPFTDAVEADQLLALEGVGNFQKRFNEDLGSPRLILLVSPT